MHSELQILSISLSCIPIFHHRSSLAQEPLLHFPDGTAGSHQGRSLVESGAFLHWRWCCWCTRERAGHQNPGHHPVCTTLQSTFESDEVAFCVVTKSCGAFSWLAINLHLSIRFCYLWGTKAGLMKSENFAAQACHAESEFGPFCLPCRCHYCAGPVQAHLTRLCYSLVTQHLG